MSSTLVTLALAAAMAATGGSFHNHNCNGDGCNVGRIVPPGPGYGWGFPNGNPDGYGYVDYGTYLPLGADRTAEYYFPRYMALPASQVFFPTYYNAYVTRGQRYLPYSNCGGVDCWWSHPASGPPLGSAAMPEHPYRNAVGTGPVVTPPPFSGRVEAPPVNTGSSGLIP
jgi:hypothetical protein